MPTQVRDRIVVALGDLYDIRDELGRGGMALVFRALDLRLRRQVAIKVLPPELAFNADVRTRFLREAQMAAQLNHPNIVPIYSVDERDSISYIVMGLVDGETLGARLHRDGPTDIDMARKLLGEVSDALDYAHGHGVIHRDVKPDNILIDRVTGRAMVTDFGIARAAAEDSRLTVTGIAIGTPAYMSPEQALGEREVDGRSDLYSLAVVGYQMLVGEPPFKANNTPSMLMKHIAEMPRPIRDRRLDAPEGLANALHRGLAKLPEERWPNAAAFKAALATGDAPPYKPASAPSSSAGNENPKDWWEVQPLSLIAPAEAFPAVPRPPNALRLDVNVPGMVLPLGTSSREMGQRVKNEIRDRHGKKEFDPANPADVEDRISKFRKQFFTTAGTLSFLAFINASTDTPPWIIFPFVGMSGALIRNWSPLGRMRLRVWDVVLEGDDAPALRDIRKERTSVRATAAALRERAKLWLGMGGLATMIFAVGRATDADFLLPPFVVASSLSALYGLGVVISGAKLLGKDMSWGEALSGGALNEPALSSGPASPVPLGDQARADARKRVAADVLEGPRGGVVIRACEDRLAILGIVATLRPDDSAMIPDVPPAADSLVDRIASLAQTVHRLDADATQENLARLDARLADLKSASGAMPPERERHRTLLERQRATVQDLVQRRDQLVSQLEHASIVLGNLRLDLVKLRSSGIGSALDDVASATQEARAVSRDIGHVLSAANEIRTL